MDLLAGSLEGPSSDEVNTLVALFKQGRYAEGEVGAKEITIRFPQHGVGWKVLGAMLKLQGRYAEAFEAMQKAAELSPRDADAHNNLGNIFWEQGRFTEAESNYRNALEIKPDFAEVHNNLGNALKKQGRLIDAETSYRRALEIKTNYVEAHKNLGSTLKDQGRFTDAETSYRRALEINPDYAEAHNNLGNALKEQGRFADAEASYQRALEIKPHYAVAYNNLANTLKDQGRLTDAETSYRRALEINPDFAAAHSNLLFTLNYDPGHNISYCLEEARRYGQMVSVKVRTRFSSWQCKPRPECLRIGLVSGDFFNHPIGYFLESILAQIDSARIELIAYHTDYKVDELTARIKPYFSAWKSLVGLNDEAAANLIHEDGIHLLLDLSGHTAKNRLPVFAWKPAPVQATWHGYLATTGVAQMDYLLGDPHVTPPENDGHFSETVWRLPKVWCCFSPPDVDIDVVGLPALETGSITFGCFQTMAKVGDKVLAVWSEILNAMPNARLRLQCKQMGDPKVVEQFVRRLQHQGIDPARISLCGGVSRKDYLAAHGQVDLILDTFPDNGCTTTCEALWMGVPTLTLAGNSMISRQGVSLLTAAGLADWVTASEVDYVAKAIAIGSDLPKLATLRANLRQNVLASPLFDASRFARHFEESLWGMWEKWQKSQGIEA